MTYIKFISLAIMVLLVIGCGKKDKIVSTKQVQQIMPLKVGNHWIYEFSQNEYDTVPDYGINLYEYRGSSLQSIVAQVNINEEEWFRMAETWYDTFRHIFYPGDANPIETLYFGVDSFIDIDYLTNRSDGLWRMSDPADSPYFSIKYPVITGDLYVIEEEVQFEVISVDKKISVPAGDFNCIHYEITYLDYHEADTAYEYYTPGIGRIYDSAWSESYGAWIMRLKDYHLE